MANDLWAVSQLATEWGVSRQTVLKYITHRKLAAWHHAAGQPYYVADTERRRFEREEQPKLKPGRPPGGHRVAE